MNDDELKMTVHELRVWEDEMRSHDKFCGCFAVVALLVFLSTIIFGCAVRSGSMVYDIQDKEFCVADEDLKLQCVNKNLDKQTYERELQPGDVITNSNDAMRATTELIDIISDLKRCQSES